MTNRPTSRQIQGHFNALRATRSHSVADKIDIASGNYASGRVFPGVVAISDPSWVGATSTFYIYLDHTHSLVLDGTEFPDLCTKIARVEIASGIIIDVIDERAEVNGLIDAYQVAFDDTGMYIASPANDVWEAIELLDAYVWSFGNNITKYIDLDLGGGIKNGLVRFHQLNDAPAVEFPKRATGVGRIRYSISVPHDWIENTDIPVRIFWSAEDSGTGNVRWRLSYRVKSSGENIDTAMHTVSISQATPGELNKLVDTSDDLRINANDIGPGSILIINIEREYSESDTYDNNARLHAVRMEYVGRGIV